ncbi:hypothetical protein BIV60_11985 [Bacillus sp. MUM 116]|uniref:VirB4 family type IV secretion system protein n=1 Tax=Bacillus sp. MUM 116 TaxID=1678002 RepID=UPI0008F5C14D|nr:hypothetical protein [Bacillus sp. MUM 116]OIK14222.1 hypothetical protein BIV60_11985 [Bacillus sp. MUM 116]
MRKLFTLLAKKEEETIVFQEEDEITFKDIILPDVVEEHTKYMQLGSNYASTICVFDYPKRVFGNWLSNLRRFQGNVTISIHLEKSPSDKMIKHLKRAIPELESREATKDEYKRRAAEKERMSNERLLDKLVESDCDIMFKVHMYIHLQAQNLKELERLEGRITNLLQRVHLKGTHVHYRAKDAFHSVLPLRDNAVPEVTNRNIDVEALSSFIPFDDSEIFHQSQYSVIKGINETTGSIVLVDHYALMNHSEFICGTSGSAKTTMMISDVLRHWPLGVKTYVIDPEGEFRKIVRALGGTLVILSNSSRTVINPMEILNNEITDTEELEEDGELQASLLSQKVQRLKILFRSMKKDLTQVEEALLEKVLFNTYKRKLEIKDETELDFSSLSSKDFPIFSDVLYEIEKLPDEEYQELRHFRMIFETYVTGSNSNMFNGHTNVDLSNDFICFDLKKLEDGSDLKKTAMYNVITFLWDEITRDKSVMKRLYIDEAHVLADPDHPLLMKFVSHIYKRIRKYKGGATVATQQIEDYLSASDGKRNYGAAIIENSYTKLILGLEEKGLQDLIEKSGIQLSEKEIKIIKRKVKAKGIYCMGTKRVQIEIVQTPEEMRLFDAARYEEKFMKDANKVPHYDISVIKRGVS